MSLQRVFESARKLGVPVIMTDPAGREPLVIVSLEQFEAMAGSSDAAPAEIQPAASRKPARPVQHQPEAVFNQGMPANDAPRQPERTEPVFEDIQMGAQQNPEISLDERFYLEPLEDGSAG